MSRRMISPYAKRLAERGPGGHGLSPRSPGRRGALLGLGALALGGVLGLAEWALRSVDAPRFDACRMGAEAPWSPDPEVGFVLAPNTTVGPGRTNELGLRGAVLPLEKAEGERRVLFVGDSTSSMHYFMTWELLHWEKGLKKFRKN